MQKLSIEMIPAYSPEARGRSERMFSTHQDRLVKELFAAGITEMTAANKYIQDEYMPAFNLEFMQPAMGEGSAFIQYTGQDLEDILCEQYSRTVGNDNCVSFEGLTLQIPQDNARLHYVKAKVRVHRYADGSLSIFHGPRKLASYDSNGEEYREDVVMIRNQESITPTSLPEEPILAMAS